MLIASPASSRRFPALQRGRRQTRGDFCQELAFRQTSVPSGLFARRASSSLVPTLPILIAARAALKSGRCRRLAALAAPRQPGLLGTRNAVLKGSAAGTSPPPSRRAVFNRAEGHGHRRQATAAGGAQRLAAAMATAGTAGSAAPLGCIDPVPGGGRGRLMRLRMIRFRRGRRRSARCRIRPARRADTARSVAGKPVDHPPVDRLVIAVGVLEGHVKDAAGGVSRSLEDRHGCRSVM